MKFWVDPENIAVMYYIVIPIPLAVDENCIWTKCYIFEYYSNGYIHIQSGDKVWNKIHNCATSRFSENETTKSNFIFKMQYFKIIQLFRMTTSTFLSCFNNKKFLSFSTVVLQLNQVLFAHSKLLLESYKVCFLVKRANVCHIHLILTDVKYYFTKCAMKGPYLLLIAKNGEKQ